MLCALSSPNELLLCRSKELIFEEVQTTWFRSHGGECSAVRIGKSDHGRGLFAARSIRAGEDIVKIPNELMLTAEKLPQAVQDLLLTDYDWCPLTLLILAEQCKGKNSVWAPYMSCLPLLGEHHSTIFWGKDELKHLECTRVFRGTLERREMISEEFHSVKKVIDACPQVFGETVSLHQFAHAYATVVSRAWNGSLVNQITLRPFVDFCNHNPVSHATVSQDACKDATVLIAERDYSEGDEVYISYGKRPNAVLAVDYGFVVPNNTFDQAELWMEIPWNDPLRERKLELLRTYNMPTLESADGSETGELPVILEEILDAAEWEDGVALPQARAFARIVCSDSVRDLQDMIEESDASKSPLAYLPRRSEEKESQATKYLMKLIEENIDLHEKALQELPESSSMQLCRREIAEAVLVGELRVLKNAKGWLSIC